MKFIPILILLILIGSASAQIEYTANATNITNSSVVILSLPTNSNYLYTLNASITPQYTRDLSTSRCGINTSGLVLCMYMDETTGTLVQDYSGNGNNGTWYGNTTINSTIGKYNTSISFDGTNDYVNVGNDSSLNTSRILVLNEVYTNSTSLGAKDPDIISRNNYYYLFYTSALSGKGLQIARSTNLTNFTYFGNASTIPIGNWNAWAPDIYTEDGIYYLLFTSSLDVDYVNNSRIYYAISTDLENWSAPTLLFNASLTSSQYHYNGTIDPFLIKKDNTYYLYITMWNKTNLWEEITISTSNNLLGTYILNSSALIKPTLTFEGGIVEAPYIINSSGIYYMYYGGGSSDNGQLIGLAKSTDLYTWIKLGSLTYDRYLTNFSKASCAPTMYGSYIFWCGTSNGNNYSIFSGIDKYYGTDSLYQLTLSAWVNSNNWNNNGIQPFLAKASAALSQANYIFSKGTNNKLLFSYYNDGWTDISDTSSQTYSNRTWYNVVVTIDNATNQVKFYVNGNLLSTQSITKQILQNNVNATIGSTLTGTQYFNGSIDEVQINYRSLSDTEITQNYQLQLINLRAKTNSNSTFSDYWNSSMMNPLAIPYSSGENVVNVSFNNINDTVVQNGVTIYNYTQNVNRSFDISIKESLLSSSLSGTILGSLNKPLSGVSITVSSVLVATSDDSGLYTTLDIFVQGQSYSVTYSKSGYTSSTQTILFNQGSITTNNIVLTQTTDQKRVTSQDNILNFANTAIPLFGLALMIIGFSIIIFILKGSFNSNTTNTTPLLMYSIMIIIIGFALLTIGTYIIYAIAGNLPTLR